MCWSKAVVPRQRPLLQQALNVELLDGVLKQEPCSEPDVNGPLSEGPTSEGSQPSPAEVEQEPCKDAAGGEPLRASDTTPERIAGVIAQAANSWLRNEDIFDILTRWQDYGLQTSLDAPNLPPGGTLFLFDRNTVRYFRKDNHAWRKKTDGRSVRETHEKLKVNGNLALNCYYAHSIDNTLQRRSYWLLDGDVGMVLVHYAACASTRRSMIMAGITATAGHSKAKAVRKGAATKGAGIAKGKRCHGRRGASSSDSSESDNDDEVFFSDALSDADGRSMRTAATKVGLRKSALVAAAAAAERSAKRVHLLDCEAVAEEVKLSSSSEHAKQRGSASSACLRRERMASNGGLAVNVDASADGAAMMMMMMMMEGGAANDADTISGNDSCGNAGGSGVSKHHSASGANELQASLPTSAYASCQRSMSGNALLPSQPAMEQQQWGVQQQQWGVQQQQAVGYGPCAPAFLAASQSCGAEAAASMTMFQKQMQALQSQLAYQQQCMMAAQMQANTSAFAAAQALDLQSAAAHQAVQMQALQARTAAAQQVQQVQARMQALQAASVLQAAQAHAASLRAPQAACGIMATMQQQAHAGRDPAAAMMNSLGPNSSWMEPLKQPPPQHMCGQQQQQVGSTASAFAHMAAAPVMVKPEPVAAYQPTGPQRLESAGQALPDMVDLDLPELDASDFINMDLGLPLSRPTSLSLPMPMPESDAKCVLRPELLQPAPASAPVKVEPQVQLSLAGAPNGVARSEHVSMDGGSSSGCASPGSSAYHSTSSGGSHGSAHAVSSCGTATATAAAAVTRSAIARSASELLREEMAAAMAFFADFEPDLPSDWPGMA